MKNDCISRRGQGRAHSPVCLSAMMFGLAWLCASIGGAGAQETEVCLISVKLIGDPQSLDNVGADEVGVEHE